jgi:DNA-binding NtrC family response regulator
VRISGLRDSPTTNMARVLIVDDDLQSVEVLRASLAASGYEVDRASHGADALMAIRLVRPDVVLLDIRMRPLSGVEVLKRLHAIDATIPVIMVTAADDPVLIRETREIGAYGYLVKPVEPQQLSRLVAEALAESRRTRPEGERTSPSAVLPLPEVR